MFRHSLLTAALLLSAGASAETAPQLTWPQITKQFRSPEWFEGARFGIWVHWGAQTQPEKGGGWYARHMYMPEVGRETWGKDAYAYQCANYGHPSEAGFKEVIHAWKAEKLDTDALLTYFKGIGAKYFVALANHHDHFDNFASTYQPWNSVKVGPKKDLIGLFAASAHRIGMPFGVSSHDDRMMMFYEHAFDADKTGPKKGVPYDGRLTKADGKGKWWEGLDPADLYGPPDAKTNKAWQQDMMTKWVLRHKELVDKYHPDMLWFDGYGFPYKEYGKELCTYFYNQGFAGKSPFKPVIVAKMPGERAVIKDIERGGATEILRDTWQGTTTFTDWFYKADVPLKQNARTLIEVLADIASKNGNFLVNVDLLPDGTIPASIKPELDGLGAWVNRNAEAIYGTKPWKIYGDNLNSKRFEASAAIDNADLEGAKAHKKSENFNERTVKSPPYGLDEVRFTTKGKKLFVIVLNPAAAEIRLPSLGLGSKEKPGKITAIRLIGEDAPVVYSQDTKALSLAVPAKRPDAYAAVFEVSGAL